MIYVLRSEIKAPACYAIRPKMLLKMLSIRIPVPAITSCSRVPANAGVGMDAGRRSEQAR
jgi:hypothetical protein